MKKNKDSFFQIVRGICIFCVVLIHSLMQSENNYILIYNIIIRQIINFCVAVFIFLSGYFINIKELKENKFKYIFKKLKRIVIPYILWSIIYLIYIQVEKHNLNIISIIKSLILGSASGHLYYIVVFVQLIILTPILLKIMQNKRFNKLPIVINFIYILISYIYSIKFKKLMPLYSVTFMAWLVFYYIGLYVRIKEIENIKIMSMKKNIILILGLLGVSIIEGFIVNKYIVYEFAISQLKLSSILYSISIIAFIIIIKQRKFEIKCNFFKKLGDYSFGIYLSHMLYIFLLQKVIIFFKINKIIVINEIMTVAITLIISVAIMKLFEKTKLKFLFGGK